MTKKNIVETFKDLGLPAEQLAQIDEAFNERVDTIVSERLQLEVDAALQKQATEHAEILDQIHKLSEQYTAQQLAQFNAKAATKLQQIIERHEQILTQRAAEHRDEMTENISNFLDGELERLIPESTLKMAAENSIARKLVDKIKGLVSLDETYVTDTVRQALTEGRALVEQQKQEIDALKLKNAKIAAAGMLVEMTQGMPSAKAKFITEQFAGKGPNFIKRNFSYVTETYDRKQTDERRQVKRRTVPTVTTRNVDRPLLSEHADDDLKARRPAKKNTDQDDPFGYLDELSKY